MRVRNDRRQTAFIFALGLVLAVLAPQSLLAHADIHERIEALDKEIQGNPTSAKLYLKRGELHRLHRDWEAALADYQRADELEPRLEEVLFLRGRMWLESGRPDQAKRELDPFLAGHPEHREALLTRARVLAELGRGLQAAQDYTRVIATLTHPTPEFYLERAKALEAEGAAYLGRALRGLDEGVAKLGSLVTLQLYAIDLELKRNHYDAALRRLDRIARWLAPERRLKRRGEILLLAGRREEARTAFSAALAELDSSSSRRNATRSFQELRADLRAALQKLPPDSSDPKN